MKVRWTFTPPNALATDGLGRCHSEVGTPRMDRPAERACHGGQALDLQARAGKAEHRKPDIETIRPQAALVDPSTRGIYTFLYSNRGAKWFW